MTCSTISSLENGDNFRRRRQRTDRDYAGEVCGLVQLGAWSVNHAHIETFAARFSMGSTSIMFFTLRKTASGNDTREPNVRNYEKWRDCCSEHNRAAALSRSRASPCLLPACQGRKDTKRCPSAHRTQCSTEG